MRIFEGEYLQVEKKQFADAYFVWGVSARYRKGKLQMHILGCGVSARQRKGKL